MSEHVIREAGLYRVGPNGVERVSETLREGVEALVHEYDDGPGAGEALRTHLRALLAATAPTPGEGRCPDCNGHLERESCVTAGCPGDLTDNNAWAAPTPEHDPENTRCRANINRLHVALPCTCAAPTPDEVGQRIVLHVDSTPPQIVPVAVPCRRCGARP